MPHVFTFSVTLFHLSRWSEKRGPLQNDEFDDELDSDSESDEERANEFDDEEDD